MHIEVQHDAGVYYTQTDAFVTASGGTPKTIIEIGTELLGTTAANTRAALDELIDAGYTVRIGDDNSMLY